MPIVQVSIAEGRSLEQIRELIRGVTDSVSSSLSAPVETIRVVITEVPPTHWGSGSQTLAEKRGPAGEKRAGTA